MNEKQSAESEGTYAISEETRNRLIGEDQAEMWERGYNDGYKAGTAANADLEKRLEKAIEALRHYADEKNWQTRDAGAGCNYYVGNGDDGYEMAVAALDEIAEEQNGK